MGVGRVEIDGEPSCWVPQQTGTKAGNASVDAVRRSLASRPFDRPRRKRRVQIESFVHLPCLGGVVLEGTVLASQYPHEGDVPSLRQASLLPPSYRPWCQGVSPSALEGNSVSRIGSWTITSRQAKSSRGRGGRL